MSSMTSAEIPRARYLERWLQTAAFALGQINVSPYSRHGNSAQVLQVATLDIVNLINGADSQDTKRLSAPTKLSKCVDHLGPVFMPLTSSNRFSKTNSRHGLMLCNMFRITMLIVIYGWAIH